jgi:hypothetical protein
VGASAASVISPDPLNDRNHAYEVDQHPDCTIARLNGGMNQQITLIGWS